MLIKLGNTQNTIDNIWFTSDHHFGHANIIEYADRPYSSVDEMDTDLIARWNSRVKPDDVVFHLGDVTLGDNADQYLDKLHGKIFVLANPWHHDKRWLPRTWHERCGTMEFAELTKIFYDVSFLPPIVVLEMDNPGTKEAHPHAITLCHYPVEEWDRKHYDAWHLHGHSHGKARNVWCRLDVGVDCWNYQPISLGEITQHFWQMGW